jgi:hypothetical protein
LAIFFEYSGVVEQAVKNKVATAKEQASLKSFFK